MLIRRDAILKIVGFRNGVPIEEGSGTLVGDKWVLTSSYCFLQAPPTNWRFDSLKVFPSFDRGVPAPDLPSASATTLYAFSSLKRGSISSNPIGLLELDSPIGNQLGWLGMLYDADSSLYDSQALQKLTYLAEPFPWDKTSNVNNDTLFFNVGKMSWESTPFLNGSLGALICDKNALPGQLGSPLILQNHLDPTATYLVASMIWPGRYRHFTLDRETLTQLAAVMEESILASYQNISFSEFLKVYPNPVSGDLNLDFSSELNEADIRLITLTGQLIRGWKGSGQSPITLSVDGIPAGTYLLEVRQDEQVIRSEKIVIN